MNRIYRLVWNRALRVLQVASEFAHSHGGGAGESAAPLRRHPLALACLAALAMAVFVPAWAAATCPAGFVSVSGTGTVGANGAIRQNGGAGGNGYTFTGTTS
ncbi:MAG: hypothetical protein KJS83_01015, partial [Xanthomonadaceae bacterium]|nr:hypothetical protein [Xanthomonadaceae bacterium]